MSILGCAETLGYLFFFLLLVFMSGGLYLHRNGIKQWSEKNYNMLLQMANLVDKTVDKEYEIKLKQYENIRRLILKLESVAKTLVESEKNVVDSQLELSRLLTEKLSSYGGSADSTTTTYSLLYAPLMIEWHDLIYDKYLSWYHLYLLGGIDKYHEHLKRIEPALKEREHLVIDYDIKRGKTKKLLDKVTANASAVDETQFLQVEKEEKEAQELFENINNQLKQELPLLTDAREHYVDLNINIFSFIQNKKLEQVDQLLADQTNPGYQASLQEVMSKMKQLEICQSL